MKKSVTILFLLLLTTFGFAGTTGKLTGKVVDAKTKEPLPFVNIILVGTNFGAATDLEGNYVILNLPPGKYTVKVQYVGYQSVIMEDVPISIDLTTRRDFELNETAVELEAVVVTGKSFGVQKDVTSSQSRVNAEQIDALPVAELNDVIQLQAGVTRDAGGAFHIRGGRTSEIAYQVNGVSITDPYDNSRGIEIDNSSVQELQVISGTFNAEYGNAMSGVINTVTKEGGREYHGDIRVYSGDYVSNFTKFFTNINNFDFFENYNYQGGLSGPVPFTNDKVTFFINARRVYDDGYLYGIRKFTINGTPGDGKAVPMNWSRRTLAQGNFTYWANQSLKFNFELLYSKEDFQNYDHFFKYNPDGNVFKFTNSYNGLFTINHILSPKTFYTVKGSYFFKDFNEHLFDDANDPRYLHPDSLNTVGFAFVTKGTNLHRFFRQTKSFGIKVDFSSQVSEQHLIQTGIDAKSHTLKFDDFTLEPLRINGIPVEPFVPSIPDENSFGRSKFNSYPYEFAAYLQDKIELNNVIINFGLRLDYFNSNGKVLVDPTDPNINIPLRPGLDSLSLAEREKFFFKDATAKWQLSPRFGIAYPISPTGVLHFSYGHFLQIPSFQFLFNGTSYKVPETGSTGNVFGNPDLDAQKTVMYELGFRQEFLNEFLIDLTVFYRDIRDWITAGPPITTRNLVTYSTYINKDYSNVRGITLTLSKRFSNYYSFDLNYTFQVAEGSNSSPDEEFRAARDNREPALFLTPLDWDQRNLLNVNLYFNYDNWGVSIIGRYGTGLPYTPSITQETSDRGISSGLQRNSRRRPSQFTVDLRIEKTLNLAGLNLTGFLRVFNLFDARTVVNVFGDTGDPEFTTEGKNVGEDPQRPNTVEEYLRFPDHYGPPRLIQTGFEFTF